MLPVVHILILAAGSSSRMRGADKLMQPVGAVPLLRHVAEVALKTGAPVTVTLPPDAPARRGALDGLELRIIEVPDAAKGMSRSLVRGIEALADLIARFQADPHRILRGGTAEGQPGHPTIFPREFWPALTRVTGDEGGRSVLRDHRGRVRVIPLPGAMALLDLDTPEDWAAWRGQP